MKFAWSPRKAVLNFQKHGVEFDEASTVFDDPLALTFVDPRHSIGEFRFLTFGATPRQRLLVVAHADRGDTIRILSAREMTPRERRDYEQYGR